jgi:hypothetical protein
VRVINYCNIIKTVSRISLRLCGDHFSNLKINTILISLCIDVF